MLKDSIEGKALLNHIMEYEAGFIASLKNDELHRQQKVIESKTLLIKRKNWENAIVIFCCVVLLCFAYKIYQLYKKKRIANEGLHETIIRRTKDLEASYAHSAQHYQHDNLFLSKKLSELSESMRNIEVMCELALKDANKEQYLKEILQLLVKVQDVKAGEKSNLV